MIFVEYPINVFSNFSCEPLIIFFLYYNDNGIPINLAAFGGASFGNRSYDQTCYFRLDKALPFISREILKQDKSVLQLNLLEFRTRLYVRVAGMIPGSVYYRQKESNVLVTKSGRAFNLVKTTKCGAESVLTD